MKFGYYRQDDSGHNYVIPEEEIEAHDELYQQIDEADEYTNEWDDLVNEYNDRYQQYRVDGDLYDMKILMEE